MAESKATAHQEEQNQQSSGEAPRQQHNEEEDIYGLLFHECDREGEGLVKVESLMDYLSRMRLGGKRQGKEEDVYDSEEDTHQPWHLPLLKTMLESHAVVDGKVDQATYSHIMRRWAREVRDRNSSPEVSQHPDSEEEDDVPLTQEQTLSFGIEKTFETSGRNSPTYSTLNNTRPQVEQALPQRPPDKVSQSISDQIQVPESAAQSTGSGVKQIPLTDIQLGELLGRGTFGAVYQGTWKSKQGRRIAVKKILHTPGTSMPKDVTTLQSLPQHPHIITYYGVAQTEDAVYIITEFAPEGSLYDHLYEKEEKPTFKQSQDWAWQIAHGMEHLHDYNIIHRDLKSANILLCIGNVAKIADFGTARYLDHTTQQTDVRGTYRWMSPEVMEEVEARINKSCDAYSYAMVLYELFEHKVPFHDKSKYLIPGIVLAGERPSITCALPSYLKNLILACWKANPQERPMFAEIVIAFEKKAFM